MQTVRIYRAPCVSSTLVTILLKGYKPTVEGDFSERTLRANLLSILKSLDRKDIPFFELSMINFTQEDWNYLRACCVGWEIRYNPTGDISFYCPECHAKNIVQSAIISASIYTLPDKFRITCKKCNSSLVLQLNTY